MGEDKERKCIAVIISKPERRYQEGLLRGICKAAFAQDMNVAVFATTLLEGMDAHQWGEKKIFDLIHYERFAGIIYAIDSFYGHEVTKVLSERLLKVSRKGIPVVTIDGKVGDLPCFYNDETDTVKAVLTHLIREHGVRDIAYMTGHKGHQHAENSLKTYRDTMSRFGLPVLQGRTYYGDYWYNKSEDFVQSLIESENGLPEAIVCANEYMAIGVYRALHARGIFVPKQIRLGCTSNDASTARYLLTGENNVENGGYEACNAIIGAMNGEAPQDQIHYVPSEYALLTSVTCGCQKASEYDYSEERGVQVDTSPGYFGECNFYREETLSQKSYASLFRKIDTNIQLIKGFRGIYFCMCEGWDEPEFLIRDTRKNPYTERMQLCYYRRELPQGSDIHIGKDQYFPKERMFPALFSGSGEPSVYLFRALHFWDRNFGYVVLDNARSSKFYEFSFNFWLRDVANALEAQCRLQSVNYMYYTDIMTGLYSRNGFNTLPDTILDEAAANGQQVLIALADMNGLKAINDTFGHEEGDTAIKACAALLKRLQIPCAAYEENFRIGGDEFVKIAVGNFTGQSLQEFKDALYASVEEFSQASGKPYRTQMSVGISVREAGGPETIDTLLSQADKRMYEEKQRLKAASVPQSS